MTGRASERVDDHAGGGATAPSLADVVLALVEAVQRLLQGEVAVAEAQVSKAIRTAVRMAVAAVVAVLAVFVALFALAAALAASFQMLGLAPAASHLAAAAVMLAGAFGAALVARREWRRLGRWPGQSIQRLRREAASVVHAFRKGLGE